LAHHYADLNEVTLHYVSEGSGKLLLFLHGFPQFWYEWKGQLSEFGQDYHAVAPDMRGYNLSSKPRAVDDYAIPKIVDDIRQLITHLGHDRCTLVGHDWGGVIAWSFAGRYPDVLDRLVVINCPHPAIFRRELRHNSDQQKASQYFNLFRSDSGAETLLKDDCAALRRILLRMGLAEGYFDEQDEKEYVKAWTQSGAIQAGLNYYKMLPLSPDPKEAAGMSRAFDEAFPGLTIEVPTLVIWGERDRAMMVENLNGLDAYVPELSIVSIREGSHWVPNEHSDRVNAEIRRFTGSNVP